MTSEVDQLANILEAAMLVAGKPMQFSQFESLFGHEDEKPAREDITQALEQLRESYEYKGIELIEVASGFRLQARQSMTPWITHLFQEKSPRYSRALMETLVLIAYRQPITRGEIEDVRGVAVSTNIIKTLLEREWVRVLGHRDVPGRPAILGTTRQFLDYFNLKRIDELPTLSEIKDLDQIDPELAKEVALLESQAKNPDIDNADQADVETVGVENPEAMSEETAAEAEPGVEGESEVLTVPTIDLSGEDTENAEPEKAEPKVLGTSESYEDLVASGDGTATDSRQDPSEVENAQGPDAALANNNVDFNLGENDSEEKTPVESQSAAQGDYAERDADSGESRSLSEIGTEMGESETLH